MTSYSDIEDVGHSIAKCLTHINHYKKKVMIIIGAFALMYTIFLVSNILQV